jgi:hypothetical protein
VPRAAAEERPEDLVRAWRNPPRVLRVRPAERGETAAPIVNERAAELGRGVFVTIEDPGLRLLSASYGADGAAVLLFAAFDARAPRRDAVVSFPFDVVSATRAEPGVTTGVALKVEHARVVTVPTVGREIFAVIVRPAG